MSTAYKLNNLNLAAKSNGVTARHHSISKSHTGSSLSSLDDTLLDSPQDAKSSTLPQDTRPFNPTKVYWVTPHGMFTNGITILDLTKDIDMSYSGWTTEYRNEVRTSLKDHSFTPVVTCRRTNWLGHRWNITDDLENVVAHWNHSWTSVGVARLTFPQTSPHAGHPIVLRNKRWGCRTESFVYNSSDYIWEPDHWWHGKNLTLYRVVGKGEEQKKTPVAKCSQKFYGAFVTGGTLVVDEKEFDGFLACLTLLVVLKKKRQRACERRNGEG